MTIITSLGEMIALYTARCIVSIVLKFSLLTDHSFFKNINVPVAIG